MKVTSVSTASMKEESAAVKDPVCGMNVDPHAPDAIKSQHGGKTYYFCSRQCKKNFDANPEKYVPKAAAAVAIDPVCGMDVDPNAPNAIKAVNGGKTYYFCSRDCKKSFEANPGKYAPKGTAAQATDPVCGMDVDAAAADAIKAVHGGKTHYFCSSHCKKTFEANPQKYEPKKSSAAKSGRERDAA
jgi:YHS domain-containing protein